MNDIVMIMITMNSTFGDVMMWLILLGNLDRECSIFIFSFKTVRRWPAKAKGLEATKHFRLRRRSFFII